MLAWKEFLFSKQDQALSFGEDLAVSNLLDKKGKSSCHGKKNSFKNNENQDSPGVSWIDGKGPAASATSLESQDSE